MFSFSHSFITCTTRPLIFNLFCDHCQCRSVAAVLVGNPDSFEGVPLTFANRWQHLLDQTVDLVVLGDTHTVGREVREVRLYIFSHSKCSPVSTHHN